MTQIRSVSISSAWSADVIRIRGARQHNLANLTIDIPKGQIVAITGVSGSGKSSLAFDTLYAEGQRRYVESFSPYARQFMDRMNRPDVDAVEGILPAVAIDQTNAIRTSRSTVGTITELSDFFKLLFAHAGVLHCKGCGEPVKADAPAEVAQQLSAACEGQRAVVGFRVATEGPAQAGAAVEWLKSKGFRRLFTGTAAVDIETSGAPLNVVVDRLALEPSRSSRLAEALETAYAHGAGVARVWLESQGQWTTRVFSAHTFHCAACDLRYPAPQPGHFSFNSPLGACERCKGFGANTELDIDLVVPDPKRSLEQHAIRPWHTETNEDIYENMLEYCEGVGIDTTEPWESLPPEDQNLVIDGDLSEGWWGVRGWFESLESQAYKMHVRVLLSRYRAYRQCADCGGSRLKPYSRLWRVGGATLPELAELSLRELRAFMQDVQLSASAHQSTGAVVQEIRDRLLYLEQAGVGYLTMNRQSRTLSGGEVQRVNLTSAIGSALVNTLIVLDEPSIGLHARDNDRLVGVLRRLRANRNSIVLVEHDDAIIRQADWLIDMGPGPGERGGRVVYEGRPDAIDSAGADSLTGQHLRGALPMPAPPRRSVARAKWIRIVGPREHNLKGDTVSLPIGALTAITGVSGSGKSTLVHEILHRAWLRAHGQGGERPGAHDHIEGLDQLKELIVVDQSPIGGTSRGNPASYVGAWDGVRRLLADTDRAKSLGHTPTTYSFNTAGGRCEGCEGTGVVRIEMQFLADQFVTCEQCEGRRFSPEVLSISWRGLSVDQILGLTADEALRLFEDEPDIAPALGALRRAGLGYLRLGQPLSTLSGGESQRLKLSKFLGKRTRQSALYLLDEPTTGLHMEDVRLLISNLHALVSQGHTVVVIEHHLDLIASADWVVDLGPEGGHAGGEVVVAGTVHDVMAHPQSHTGHWLSRHLHSPEEARRWGLPLPSSPPEGLAQPSANYQTALPGELPLAPERMEVHGARVHNLKNISVFIPRGVMAVITGPSGSGKSSLAFDVLFAEGQRRFMDCLSPYARQYVQQVGRPDLDSLLGVPPTVCISQRTSRAGRRSTVATVTEIYHYLRLLWARLGVQHCPQCGDQVGRLTPAGLSERVLARFEGKSITLLAPAVRGRKGWHKEIFARAVALGHPIIRVDGHLAATSRPPELSRHTEHDIEYVVATWTPNKKRPSTTEKYVTQGLELGDGTIWLIEGLDFLKTTVMSTRSMCNACGVGVAPADPKLFSFNAPSSACPTCAGTGESGGGSAPEGEDDAEIPPHALGSPCSDCGGSRLGPPGRTVKLGGLTLPDLMNYPPPKAAHWLENLTLSEREHQIGGTAIAEALSRCRFLCEVGLEHLSLGRGANTLSGGEAQRVRLAAQLGAELSGVLYVLDEPTIGLHPADNAKLLGALQRLVDRHNSVLVVEHDDETMRRADWLIELGPEGGQGGGQIVDCGPTAQVLQRNACATARALNAGGRNRAVHRQRPTPAEHPSIWLEGARLHNLRGHAARFPLGRLTVVTGVSGSGKSTLVRDALSLNLKRERQDLAAELGIVRGGEGIKCVREIDQTPIGRTPASTPATYVGLYDEIRKVFAGLPEAKARGYKATRFSFNTKVGRCEECKGQGQIRHEMNFLPDVFTPCHACNSLRFDTETLSVTYRGANIGQVLQMTVSEALALFGPHAKVARALKLLSDTGLGYLQLGQPSHTLSGGEAQRIKLAAELQKEGGTATLYIMDEPSTGLHMDDLRKLIEVIQRLVDRGDTVVLIEHNLDVIASADWIIDLGPGGGTEGGNIVTQGPRETVAQDPKSITGAYLSRHLAI